VSFLLRPADGTPAPAARAGQYVSVRVRMPDGVHQLRQYGLSSAPGDRTRRITAKRAHGDGAPEGEVSNLLHRTLRAGDELTLSAPFGDVVLDRSDRPLVLVSAGIGCTPMVGMLEHLAAAGSTRPVTVLHADRSPGDHALRADTDRLVERLPDARTARRCPRRAVRRCAGPGAPHTGRAAGPGYQPLVTRYSASDPQFDPWVQVDWLAMPPAQSTHMPLP
jgi:nitric oxide dioxygenase